MSLSYQGALADAETKKVILGRRQYDPTTDLVVGLLEFGDHPGLALADAFPDSELAIAVVLSISSAGIVSSRSVRPAHRHERWSPGAVLAGMQAS